MVADDMDAQAAMSLIDTLFDEIQDSIDRRYVFDSITIYHKEAFKFLCGYVKRHDELERIVLQFHENIMKYDADKDDQKDFNYFMSCEIQSLFTRLKDAGFVDDKKVDE
jgi:hypothetical protein